MTAMRPVLKAFLLFGREHFADHCASCHANDGSGDTTIGRGLYPRSIMLKRRAADGV